MIHLPCHQSEFCFLFYCSFEEGPIPTKNDPVGKQISNFLVWMKIFMDKNRTKSNTFATYKPHMKRMLSLWIHKKWLKSVYSLWNLNERDLIPNCDQYVDSIDSDPNKEQAVNSYKKVNDENTSCVTIVLKMIFLNFRSVTLSNENWGNKPLLNSTKLTTYNIRELLSNPTETWPMLSLDPYVVPQKQILLSLLKDKKD